jgi:hypothetical protein
MQYPILKTQDSRLTTHNARLKTSSLVLSAMFLALCASAQDPQKVLEDLRHNYQHADPVHAEMIIRAYSDANKVQPYYEEQAEVKRSGKNYWYRFGQIEMLMNEKYLLMVERESRQIVCSKRDIKAEEKMSKQMQFNTDSLLAFLDKPVFIGTANGIHQYRVTPREGDVRQIDLYVNAKKSTLHMLTYQYQDANYVTIAFPRFDSPATFSPDDFDEKRYVEVTKTSIHPAKAFGGFEVSRQ